MAALSNPSRWRGLLLNSALTLTSVLIAVLALEGLTRLFYQPAPAEIAEFRLGTSDYYRADEKLGWLPNAGIRGEHSRDSSFSSVFTTNTRGLRDDEHSYDKPPGIRRIVVLGDSFTWGYGVDNEDLYARQLEKLLERVEVINLGVTGYGLLQEARYLNLEGRKYQPDVVLVGLCQNDIHDIYRRVIRSGEGIPKQVGAPEAVASRGALPSLKRFLADHSALYGFVVDRVNTNKALVDFFVKLGIKEQLSGFEAVDTNLTPSLIDYPPVLTRAVTDTRAELIELQRIAGDAGARLVVAAIPPRQAVDREAFVQSIAYTTFDSADFDLDKPYRLLQEMAVDAGFEFVNPVEVFRSKYAEGAEIYLPRDMHFSPAGHRLFAEEVATRVQHLLSCEAGAC